MDKKTKNCKNKNRNEKISFKTKQEKNKPAEVTNQELKKLKGDAHLVMKVIISVLVAILVFVVVFQKISKENVMPSPETDSIAKYKTISCEKICKPTIFYQNLCSCISTQLKNIMEKVRKLKKPIDKTSVEISFHKYATHSLMMESISDGTGEETEIIKNATLYAEKLNLKNFNLKNLLEIHRRVMVKDGSIGGKIRTGEMFVPGKDAFIRKPGPQELMPQMTDFLKWFSTEIYSSETNPIIFAAMAKLVLIRIHPFADGNGRTSRILLCVILKKIMPVWITIPANEIIEYYDVIGEVERSSNIIPYLQYIIKCVDRSLDLYIKDTQRAA